MRLAVFEVICGTWEFVGVIIILLSNFFQSVSFFLILVLEKCKYSKKNLALIVKKIFFLFLQSVLL